MDLPEIRQHLAATVPTRLHVHEGAIYLIRDLWRETGCQCQYATRKGMSYVDLEWTDCAEGVSFADIEPVARVADLILPAA